MNEVAVRLRAREGLDPLLSFGGVALTVAAVVAYERMQDSWAAFPLFLLVAVPCALLFYLALLPSSGVPREGQPSARWQSALLAVGHLLLFGALVSLVRVLGEDNPGSATATWTLAVTGLSALFFSERLDSPGLRLLGLLVVAGSVLALVAWIDENASTSAYRDVLLAEGVLFLLYARTLYGLRPDHSHVAASAAVVALVAGATLGVFGGLDTSSLFGGFGPTDLGENDGWELLLLAVSIGALAYSGWQRYRGTVYPGAVGLLFFLSAAARGNLAGWPLILALVALGCFAWALFGGPGRPGAGRSAGAGQESSGM
jgi:hypothetical protein